MNGIIFSLKFLKFVPPCHSPSLPAIIWRYTHLEIFLLNLHPLVSDGSDAYEPPKVFAVGATVGSVAMSGGGMSNGKGGQK